MGNTRIKVILSLASAGVVVVLFQNCGKSGFESQAQLDSLTTGSSVDSKVSAAPFPWDASVNFISHMSCPNVNQYSKATNSPYFTFRVAAAEVGAYRQIHAAALKTNGANHPDIADAGVTLRQEFLDYLDKSFARTTDHASSATIQQVLTTHPVFQNAQLQLTFRKDGYLDQWGLRPDNSSIVTNLMDKLGSPDFAKALADQPGVLVNSFPIRAEAKRNFRGQLHATTSPPSFDDVTFNLTMASEYYLHVGFNESTQQSASNITIKGIGPIADNQSRLYGRGFRFSFGSPNDSPLRNFSSTDKLRMPASNPPLAIAKSSVSEWDTSPAGGPTQLGARWACFSYAIVRAEDATRCPREPYENIKRDELDIIRKTLPADEWDVNTTLKCIVPTSYAANAGSCYIENAANDIHEPAYPMYFGNPEDLVTNPVLANYVDALRTVKAGNTANDYLDVFDTGAPDFFKRTGVEYRYFKHTCAQGRERQCVNFASFCYRLK